LESNWRWNVYRLSMSGSDFLLIARRPLPVVFEAYGWRKTETYWQIVRLSIVPGQVPVEIGYYTFLPGEVHFPWLLDVEPDNPV